MFVYQETACHLLRVAYPFPRPPLSPGEPQEAIERQEEEEVIEGAVDGIKKRIPYMPTPSTGEFSHN